MTATGRVGRAGRDAQELRAPKKGATNEDDPEASGYYFEDTDTHAAKIKSVVGRVTSEADSAAKKARKVSTNLGDYMKRLDDLFNQLADMTEKQNKYVAKINADAMAEEVPRNAAFDDLDKEMKEKKFGESVTKGIPASLEEKSLIQDQKVDDDEIARFRQQVDQLEAAASVGNEAHRRKT